MTDSKTEIILIRHGETAWNAESRIQGHLDIPLNEIGLAQAAALGSRFKAEAIDAIYSSDLRRADRTAAPIAASNGHRVLAEPRLRERHLGVLQGLTRDEALSRLPEAWVVFKARRSESVLEGGEALGDFFRRVVALLLELCERHAGQRIVAVTHGGVLDAAYRHVVGMPLEIPRNFPVRNASINVLGCCAGLWTVEAWGDVSHLPRLSRGEDT